MTTLQKTIIAAALTAAIGTGIYAYNQNSQLNARIRTLEREREPLTAQIRRLQEQNVEASNQMAAVGEENARLKSSRTADELRKLRGEVGTLRQMASNPPAHSEPASGFAKMMSDPTMKDYIRQAQKGKFRQMYGELFKELQLTPEQSEQFIEAMSDVAFWHMEHSMNGKSGTENAADNSGIVDAYRRLQEVLGTERMPRFQEYSRDLPGHAVVSLVRDQLGATPFTEEQNASFLRIMRAEPEDLTRGILGAPDPAFSGSPADVDQFLQKVAQSNERILKQAAEFLNATQLTALEAVLTQGIENRKLQGAAFFEKH